MPLERLPPLALSFTDGAGVDIVSVHVLVCQEVLPVGKALATGGAGEDDSCVVETINSGYQFYLAIKCTFFIKHTHLINNLKP